MLAPDGTVKVLLRMPLIDQSRAFIDLNHAVCLTSLPSPLHASFQHSGPRRFASDRRRSGAGVRFICRGAAGGAICGHLILLRPLPLA